MSKPIISFRAIDGSGPLSIYWTDGPYGDAIEAVSGNGVAWLSPRGDILGVEFDDVSECDDVQELKLSNGESVKVVVKKGKVKVQKSRSVSKTG